MMTDNKLHGKLVHVFTGSGWQVCTVESGLGGPLPFRARSQRNGYSVDFGVEIAKKLRVNEAPGMKLLN